MPSIEPRFVYQTLIKEITSLYRQAQRQSQAAVNRILTEVYWEIGRRIIELEQNHLGRAPYGEHLIDKLSQDLTGILGKGFSPENIRKMRRFYLCYPVRSAPKDLDWTHYKVLAAVKEDYKRKYYEREAVKNQWSSRDLIHALQEDHVAHEPFRERRPAETAQTIRQLSVKRGVPYLYAVKEVSTLNRAGIDRKLAVDCGFFVTRDVLEEPEGLKDGSIIASEKTRKKYQWTLSREKADALYTYIAYPVEVVDADTIWVEVDLGFGTYLKEKLRLRGINAPELKTKKGELARDFVKDRMKFVDFVIIKTYREDKYGRFLADIFSKRGEKDPFSVAAAGWHLNQVLLDEGLANLY